MDKNQGIGLLLMLALLLGWFYFTMPSEEQIAEQKRIQDSIALAEQPVVSEGVTKDPAAPLYVPDDNTAIASNAITSAESNDTTVTPIPAATPPGKAESYTLKNDVMTVTFNSQGGYPTSILLHDHFKIGDDEDNNEIQMPLKLMDDDRNKFEYLLPINGKGIVSTRQMLFDANQSGNGITFTTNLGSGASLSQTYTIAEDYTLDYVIDTKNLSNVLSGGGNQIEFNWENYLDKLEKNVTFEKYYTTVYFKENDETSDYCNCRSDDEEDSDGSLKWISHVNQFFNTSIVADNSTFEGGSFETQLLADDDKSIKLVKSKSKLTFNGNNASKEFTIYAGPNDFDVLKSYGVGLEEVIPFGRSIFGWINTWIIRPSFNFLSQYIGSKGIVIIVLIFIIKMLLYPLTYKMLQSQAKMGALKPKLAGLTEKFKDDPQKKQVETMAIYREYGVSPLGGCMPMVVQMPIWYALFRFFPASITFRQEPFLWATDLSSYDVIATLPFTIPAFGSHISLFTVLWAVTTVLYTYYNTKHMDMSANPAMKYVQYAMPLMFLVFFNNYASGLTCYMFFSNLFNIMQTVLTKKFVFNDEKILAELEQKKDKQKDKPKTGFQARLEKAMREQQEVAKKRQQQQQGKKKKRK